MPHSPNSPHPLLKPASLYFALTFAAGFALGPVRMFILTPRLGPVAAVLIEAPFILLASYLIARWVLKRFAPHASTLHRLKIGIVAFGMLIAAEFLLSLTMSISPRAFLQSLTTPAGAIGLAGQVIFAFIPTLIRPTSPEKLQAKTTSTP